GIFHRLLSFLEQRIGVVPFIGPWSSCSISPTGAVALYPHLEKVHQIACSKLLLGLSLLLSVGNPWCNGVICIARI
ncbi:hypothetical protein Tco_0507273, partial [Tanacetum coccineum]